MPMNARKINVGRIHFCEANLVREVAQASSLWGNQLADVPGSASILLAGSGTLPELLLTTPAGSRLLRARDARAPHIHRLEADATKLNARATAAVVAGVFHRTAFWFNFRQAGTAFHFHNLVAQ